MNRRSKSGSVLTCKQQDAGRAAAESTTPAPGNAGSAEKAVLRIYLADYRPPSLNRILSQHWTWYHRHKQRSSRLIDRAACALRDATGKGSNCLTTIILWEGPKGCVTPSARRSSDGAAMPKAAGSRGNTVRSRGAARWWKSLK